MFRHLNAISRLDIKQYMYVYIYIYIYTVQCHKTDDISCTVRHTGAALQSDSPQLNNSIHL